MSNTIKISFFNWPNNPLGPLSSWCNLFPGSWQEPSFWVPNQFIYGGLAQNGSKVSFTNQNTTRRPQTSNERPGTAYATTRHPRVHSRRHRVIFVHRSASAATRCHITTCRRMKRCKIRSHLSYASVRTFRSLNAFSQQQRWKKRRNEKGEGVGSGKTVARVEAHGVARKHL